MESSELLEMKAVSKRFPGVQALDQVDFDLAAGEVHALVGENGAGKSTLMRILCGAYQPDDGEIYLSGERVVIQNPAQAQSLGISIVYQEFSLFANLSVAENIFVGRQPVSGYVGFVDRTAALRESKEYLDLFELAVDPDCPVGRLSVAQQQVVEIAKALSLDARILILDEPTSTLSEHETQLLFQTIRRLKERGLGIIYISHRLEEVFEIADRVTVLRDGHLVGTVSVSAVQPEALIRMMVGRQLQDLYGGRVTGSGEEVLRVEGLSSSGHFEDVGFTLHRGEILGLAGLVGAGRTDVARAVFGAQRYDAGHIYLEGREVLIHSPKDAMRLGIAYLSENRYDDELFLRMSVRENITVTHLEKFSRLGFMFSSLEAEEVVRFVQRLSIRTPGIEQQVMNLSGGNQQKVILARWLAIHPKVLIADEPTRGIDVGAKAEIYALLHDLAAEGVGILFISSELPEILGMSDRILVMNEGRVAGEVSGDEATEELIVALSARQLESSKAPAADGQAG